MLHSAPPQARLLHGGKAGCAALSPSCFCCTDLCASELTSCMEGWAVCAPNMDSTTQLLVGLMCSQQGFHQSPSCSTEGRLSVHWMDSATHLYA